MRDAQSMLDQLVAFCGDHITEENVLDVFGFTSREKVAALTSALLARDTPAALVLIQKEAESGRELSQLLGELIGCLRALLVAKLDPSADGEGIPAELWNNLLRSRRRLPARPHPRRHRRLRRNRRPHEMGHQQAPPFRTRRHQGHPNPRRSPHHRRHQGPHPRRRFQSWRRLPTAKPSSPTPHPHSPPNPPRSHLPSAKEPKPAGPPAKPKAPPPQALAAFDSLIDAAPEDSAPPPAAEAAAMEGTTKTRAAPEPATAPAGRRSFYQDPLIQAALEKFEGKVVAG